MKELTLVAKNQNHTADFEQSKLTVLTENRAVHDVYTLQCFSFKLGLNGLLLFYQSTFPHPPFYKYDYLT